MFVALSISVKLVMRPATQPPNLLLPIEYSTLSARFIQAFMRSWNHNSVTSHELCMNFIYEYSSSEYLVSTKTQNDHLTYTASY